ncbi:MAG: amidohydrolase [Clostridiaceae bacterium]|nr:amidohydrolase [Clostridiaceae bacterium]
MMIIHNVKLMTMDPKGVIENGCIVVRDGRIDQVMNRSDWNRMDYPADIEIIDGKGGTVTPAFIDAHSHLGLFDDSLDMEGSDGNEMTDPITPHLRAIDGIHNADVSFREAMEGGVGVVMTGPGSGNVLGGQFAIIRTYEKTVEDALVCEPAAQKAAFGENPKREYGKDNKSPQTRMGTAALLRQALREAVAYKEKQSLYEEKLAAYRAAVEEKAEDIPEKPEKPDPDMPAESMLPVIEGKIPLKIHAHRQDDILTAIRICNEFGLTYTLEHCTEGHLISDVLVKEYNAGQSEGRGSGNGPGGRLRGIVIGPIIGFRSKPELSNLTIRTAAVLANKGLPVAVMTDHPCVPQQYLVLSAAIAVSGGMSEQKAIEAITIRPAEIMGIDDRYGSLTEGKEADFCLFDRNPLDYRAKLLLFVGRGKIRYEARSGIEPAEV